MNEAATGIDYTITSHERFDDQSRSRWRQYLTGHAFPTHWHDPAWADVFRDGLGHRPIYLEYSTGRRTAGVLPLVFMKSALFGRFLVSLPYLNGGGPLADSDEVARRLIDEAVRLAGTLDVRYLELRNLASLAHPNLPVLKTEKVLMWYDLPAAPGYRGPGVADESGPMWDAMKSKIRSQVRRRDGEELTVLWGGRELLPEFHAVFSRRMRDLGTPVFGRELFAAMLEHLPDMAELCVVRRHRTAIAAALLIHGEGVTEVPSAAALAEGNPLRANMFLYYHLLDRAVRRGQYVFDFGRSSPDSGTHRFKRQWGAAERPTHWQYHVRTGDVGDVRPDHPKYATKIAVWKRLPLWVTRLLGPPIVRGIP